MSLITYSKLKKELKTTSWFIPYDRLLLTFEWQELRTEILERDKKTCTVCNSEQSERINNEYFRVLSYEERTASVAEWIEYHDNGSELFRGKTAEIYAEPTEDPVILHIHHKYYIYGDCPWEYPKSALITVCHKCHLKIHQTTTIPVYSDQNFNSKIDLTPCLRCSGTGFMPEYHYYQNGICFKCGGKKFEELINNK